MDEPIYLGYSNTAGSRPSGSFFTQVDHLFLHTDLSFGNIHENEKVTS